MGYKNGGDVLPRELLSAIQRHIDGEYIYIPRKESGKLPWGTRTDTRRLLVERNREIAAKRRAGLPVAELADRYFLSVKTVYKIIAAQNR